MSKKLGKKKKDSMSKMLDADANLDKKSYELGLAHGHSRALYLIKLCLDGYKEAAADPSAMKEHFPDDDDITLENKRVGLEVHADAVEFVLGFVHSQWEETALDKVREEATTEEFNKIANGCKDND